MAAQTQKPALASSNRESTSANSAASTFNGREVSAYLKQSWTAAVEASNNPNVPAQEKPEMFRAPNAPSGAWGSTGAAWSNRPNPVKDAQMADGSPFLVGLARAVDAHKKTKK